MADVAELAAKRWSIARDVPGEWGLSASGDDAVTPYSLDLHFCRLTRLAGLPTHGERLGGADLVRRRESKGQDRADEKSEEEDGRWVCVALDVSLNQLRSGALAVLDAVPQLRRLNASLNKLSSLRRLPRLEELRELDVSHNVVAAARGMPALPRLRVLDVSHNGLTSLLGLPELPELRELRCAGNDLEGLTGLETSAPALTSLHAANNARLCDMHPLALLQGLEHVDLAHCGVAKVDEAASVAGSLPSLSSLALRGCPVAEEPTYRFALATSGSLQELDGRRITAPLRRRLERLHQASEAEAALSAMTEAYASRVEVERQRKADKVRRARERMAAEEDAFAQFKGTVDAELEDCSRFVNALLRDPRAMDRAWLGTREGLTAWREAVARDLAETRRRAERAEAEAAAADSRRYVSPMARGLSSADALQSMRSLAYARPAAWRRLKQAELARARAEAGEEEEEDKEEEAGEAKADLAARRERQGAAGRLGDLVPPENAEDSLAPVGVVAGAGADSGSEVWWEEGDTPAPGTP